MLMRNLSCSEEIPSIGFTPANIANTLIFRIWIRIFTHTNMSTEDEDVLYTYSTFLAQANGYFTESLKKAKRTLRDVEGMSQNVSSLYVQIILKPYSHLAPNLNVSSKV